MKFSVLSLSALVAGVPAQVTDMEESWNDGYHKRRDLKFVKAANTKATSSGKKSGKKICLQYGIEETIAGPTTSVSVLGLATCYITHLFVPGSCNYEDFLTCVEDAGGLLSPFNFDLNLIGLFDLGGTAAAAAIAAASSSFVFSGDQSTTGDCAFKGTVNPTSGTVSGDELQKVLIESNDPDKWGTTTLQSISYDFFPQTCGGSTTSCHGEFYLNIYTHKPPSGSGYYSDPFESANGNTFYDCRYDYVPQYGPTSSWTNFEVSASTLPSAVDIEGVVTCPPTLAAAFEDGFVLGTVHGGQDPDPSLVCGKLQSMSPGNAPYKPLIYQINMGDTSASDNGLIGFLDNIQVTYAGEPTTVYDLECE